MLRPLAAVPLLATLTLSACMSQNDPAAVSSLQDAVESACAPDGEKDICIAYRDLESGRTLLRDGDLVLHAASTMKIAVMYAAFLAHDRKTLDLDAPVPVANTFKSIVDGSPYTLTANDDSEKDLYEKLGTSLPSRELVRRMMVRSSNLATNLMVDVVGADTIQRTMESLDIHRMKVLRGVEDGPAFAAGLNNVATAHDLMLLLEAIWRGEGVSPASREAMMQILLAQEFNDLIPAGVPAGTPVAHKTGLITGIRHDAGIVMPATGSPYVLVVLTRGFTDQDEAARAVARVSRSVWTQLNGD